MEGVRRHAQVEALSAALSGWFRICWPVVKETIYNRRAALEP